MKERGVLCVLDTKPRTVVVAEIKLREVAMQVGLANAVIHSDDPPLEDRKERLRRVRMDETAEARMFVGAVVHGLQGEVRRAGSCRANFPARFTMP